MVLRWGDALKYILSLDLNSLNDGSFDNTILVCVLHTNLVF